MPTAAEVVEIKGSMGVKGVRRVRCRVLGGTERKTVTRNVVGPIRVGDVLMLKETAMETEGGVQRKG